MSKGCCRRRAGCALSRSAQLRDRWGEVVLKPIEPCCRRLEEGTSFCKSPTQTWSAGVCHEGEEWPPESPSHVVTSHVVSLVLLLGAATAGGGSGRFWPKGSASVWGGSALRQRGLDRSGSREAWEGLGAGRLLVRGGAGELRG